MKKKQKTGIVLLQKKSTTKITINQKELKKA